MVGPSGTGLLESLSRKAGRADGRGSLDLTRSNGPLNIERLEFTTPPATRELVGGLPELPTSTVVQGATRGDLRAGAVHPSELSRNRNAVFLNAEVPSPFPLEDQWPSYCVERER